MRVDRDKQGFYVLSGDRVPSFWTSQVHTRQARAVCTQR